MTSLIEKWNNAKQAENEAIALRRKVEQEIIIAHEAEINQQLDADYQTGTAKLKGAAGTLILSFPKKIDWDSEKLASIYNEIQATGENSAEYIEAKFSVLENKYKAWPEYISKTFTSARTVKAGNPSFSFKESE